MTASQTSNRLVGNDIIGLITLGMYDNPLAIYREYIQNSADAIATTVNVGGRSVKISIDPTRLCVRIRDNGPGLSYGAAIRALIPVARSQKLRATDRGFRGIGRLAGLAFAQSVSFLTRSQPDQSVTRVVWDGSILRSHVLDTSEAERAIRKHVSVETVSGVNFPDHFFEVRVNRVARYAAGSILNRDAVRAYISEVCPVPMQATFPFASRVKELFGENEAPLTLDVILDDEHIPVTRQYSETIQFSQAREDCFTEFEEVHVPSLDGNGKAAIGWISHSSYLGAIPKKNRIRGVRARAGNIQIGDEKVFDHLFPEDRFNRWCVGEIHIMDARIAPNGRRDYFEPSPHVRNLENRLGAVFRRIASRCRKASSIRNRERKFLTALCQIEETYDLAISGYLSHDRAKALVENTLDRIKNIRANMGSMNSHGGVITEKLDALERKLSGFHVKNCRQPFGDTPKREVAVYRRIFQALASVSQSPATAKEVMEAVLSRT